MARAREMGFFTENELYHGTDASFPAFAPTARNGNVRSTHRRELLLLGCDVAGVT